MNKNKYFIIKNTRKFNNTNLVKEILRLNKI